MPSSAAPAVKVVLDTNVLVSGLLNAKGPPSRLVDLVLAGVIEPVLSAEILEEYRCVLSRKELGLPPARVGALLEFLDEFALPLPVPTEDVCPDPEDAKFLASAIEGGAQWLVTGNIRYYPASPYRGVVLLNPAEAERRLLNVCFAG